MVIKDKLLKGLGVRGSGITVILKSTPLLFYIQYSFY